jgi:hypothetical protein
VRGRERREREMRERERREGEERDRVLEKHRTRHY